MRKLLYLLSLLVISLNVSAQYVTVTNLSGTAAYGSTNVTVTTSGSALSTPWCGVNPYWIGLAGPGSYIYNFSTPKKAIRVYVTAMNVLGIDSEKITIFINGTFYNMTLANLSPYAGTCSQPTQTIYGGALVCTAAALGVGGGGQLDIYQCGITQVEVHTNGVLNGSTFTFQFDSVGACFHAWANEPCLGDSLHLKAIGDSLGAVYSWTGPGGFTSTEQYPSKFPASYLDTGYYRVIRTILGVSDTDSVHVVVHPPPIIGVSNNSPLCAGLTSTLSLYQTPGAAGGTYLWTGPGGFTSTVQNPTRSGFSAADTGLYKLVVTSVFGCRDSGVTSVTLVAPPPAPTITGVQNYCQGVPFVAFTVTGYTGSLRWYTVGTGGTGSTVAPVVPTSTPGTYTYWVSQLIGSCESPRSSITVRVVSVPPAPLVTGVRDYCQFIGPVMPLTVTPSDSTKWYTSAVGGPFTWIEPLPNINVPGALNTWVSRVDSGCEGPKTPVTITIHPKPSRPNLTPDSYCQFFLSHQIGGTPSIAGDTLKWYGPGVTPPMYISPTPTTSFAPDTITYYATETSSHGCVSDSASVKIVIKKKPDAPTATNVKYCQEALGARPLNEVVDSDFNSVLRWYDNSANPIGTPTPNTFTVPGTTTWWVKQIVPATNGCASDSIPVRATIIYKPKFTIEPSKNWVCQFDSITLAYKSNGPALNFAIYLWTVPFGAEAVNNTKVSDSMITVRFDSAGKYNFIRLRAENESGMCYSDTMIPINVIPLPTMQAYTKVDVCLGDTVDLALYTRTDNAYEYEWWVDKDIMANSHALNIVSSNSHSSGPYTISWIDTGRHIIKVSGKTAEGCKSDPTFDSVLVHNIPDASFRISSPNGSSICLEDSVEFTATEIDWRNSYYWTPEHDFNNINKPVIWGKMLEPKGLITLKVTDPFGCYATKSMEINPDACCSIAFPNAFAPSAGGQKENDIFKPYYTGYHRFHMFRIVNRWGQTIFESHNSNVMGWDGTYNGVPQDMGVYYYILKYDCGGKAMEAKGDVTLIR